MAGDYQGAPWQEWRHGALHRLQVAALRRSKDLDHDRCARLGHPPGFAQRRDHVGGEEERVEAGDEVEDVVAIGEELHVAHAQVGRGHPGAGDLDQCLGRVEAEDTRASIGRRAQEDTEPQPTMHRSYVKT